MINGDTHKIVVTAIGVLKMTNKIKDNSCTSSSLDGQWEEVSNLCRSLSPAMTRWGILDKNGSTLAHLVASLGLLPVGFNLWHIVDKNGWTVAHAAAVEAALPADFDQWGLTALVEDGVHETVLEVLLTRGGDYHSFVARWDTEKPLCKSSADWEAFKFLPEIYSKHSILENMHNGTAADIPTL
jgi:hypothetical protein